MVIAPATRHRDEAVLAAMRPAHAPGRDSRALPLHRQRGSLDQTSGRGQKQPRTLLVTFGAGRIANTPVDDGDPASGPMLVRVPPGAVASSRAAGMCTAGAHDACRLRRVSQWVVYRAYPRQI
jgi:hypothetical protein